MNDLVRERNFSAQRFKFFPVMQKQNKDSKQTENDNNDNCDDLPD